MHPSPAPSAGGTPPSKPELARPDYAQRRLDEDPGPPMVECEAQSPSEAHAPGVAAAAAAARGTRRRTGPLSTLQRKRAALIRKLGACPDCRRRRVACHPNHHNMTWEDAAAKYRSHSPISMQDMSPLGATPCSPAAHTISPSRCTHDPQERDLDDTPAHAPPHRPPPMMAGDARMRTPLPSGPRLDRTGSVVGSATMLPCIDSVKTDLLQSTASRIVSSQYRSPYTAADVLALHWLEDDDMGVGAAMDELTTVLSQHYQYTVDRRSIPSSSDGCRNSWRWLSRAITEFIDRRDQRDVLKVVYYNGHTLPDANRDMVLASSKTADPTFAIRWSGIQQILETASSDTLVIMDAAYYPSSQLVRQQGVLELIAACASDDPARGLERNVFTRALAHELHDRANLCFASPLSTAELHAKLLTLYPPSLVRGRSPDQQHLVVRLPSPLHIQLSGNPRLPSILLAPVSQGAAAPLAAYGLESPPSAASTGAGATLGFTFRLADESINVDSWMDWLRMMPEGIREVKVDGLYRNTFR